MNRTAEGFGLGWIRDHPDVRDYTPESNSPPPPQQDRNVADLLAEVGVEKVVDDGSLAPSVDLRSGFSPIEDQGQLGSCTANAGAGVLEYFERQSHGRHIDVSRLFLYKATRDLMGETGDTGAFLRTTMQALALFGAPPESYWPYDITSFDREPTAFCYAFAQDYRALQYYRLAPPGTDPEQLLLRIKTNLAAGLPAMFGFTVYSSYSQAGTTGAFPMPAPGEGRVGGHAIVAAGYDDGKVVQNTSPGGPRTEGALLIRNSWGTSWGEDGYGWLPYDYVRSRLAVDWWSLIKAKWVDDGQFGS